MLGTLKQEIIVHLINVRKITFLVNLSMKNDVLFPLYQYVMTVLLIWPFFFLVLFQKYGDVMADRRLWRAECTCFLNCCWNQGHRIQINLISKALKSGNSGLILTVWGVETFCLLRLSM